MESSCSRNADFPQVGTATPNTQSQDIAEGRRELARLIGRLLAHEWLQKQRSGDNGQAPATAGDPKNTHSA